MVLGRRQEAGAGQDPGTEGDLCSTHCHLAWPCLERCALLNTTSLPFQGAGLPKEAGDGHWRLTHQGEDSVLPMGSADGSISCPLRPAPARATPPIPLKEAVSTQQPVLQLTRAWPPGSSFLVFCQPEGIMDPLILFHWLVKGHNQIVMGKDAGNGRGQQRLGGCQALSNALAVCSPRRPAARLRQDG